MSSGLGNEFEQPFGYPPYYNYPEYPSEDWLLDEDRALRDLMKGIVVSDHENASRPVHAWFGHPDQELRSQDYPYITVDLVNIQEGLDRVHRGDHYRADPPHWWNMTPLEPGQYGYLIEMPTPVDLDYHISTWSRNPRHDRQILKQLITGGRTRLRQGRLFVSDHTNRRLDVLSHVKRDTVEDGKRLFNNVFRIRVSSEVPWQIIGPMYGAWPVKDIYLNLVWSAYRQGVPIDRSHITGAEVLSYDEETHTSDIKMHSMTFTGVSSLYNVGQPYLRGDMVAVLQTPLIQNPTVPDDYRLLILGLEIRPEFYVEHFEAPSNGGNR